MGGKLRILAVFLLIICSFLLVNNIFAQNYIGFGNFNDAVTIGVAHKENSYTIYGGFSYGFSGLLGVGVQGGYRAANLLEVQVGELGKWRMGIGAGANGTAMFSIFSPIPFYVSAGAGIAFFHDWDFQNNISLHWMWIGGIGVATSPWWIIEGFVQPTVSTFFGISF
ncbi:MAG: hypothetical protein PWQ20_1511 [Thermotogaceae bacterium]|jgi:hypothetical protein|nr:hypothetical protein [Thermotogaceae bacterium]